MPFKGKFMACSPFPRFDETELSSMSWSSTCVNSTCALFDTSPCIDQMPRLHVSRVT